MHCSALDLTVILIILARSVCYNATTEVGEGIHVGWSLEQVCLKPLCERSLCHGSGRGL